MWKDMGQKLTGTLRSIIKLFWPEGNDERAAVQRKLVASSVMLYAVDLCYRAGYTLDEVQKNTATTWTESQKSSQN